MHDDATGAEKVFAVHEDDRRDIAANCVSWASPRFLEYHATVHGWLDVETMKIALDRDDVTAAGALAYDKDFRWVVGTSDGRARLGKIALPAR